MKNEKLYEQYAIEGWPCPFLSMTACDKYNDTIEKYCNQLPEGAEELSAWQGLKRSFILLWILPYDIIMFKKEKREWGRTKNS